MSAEASVLADYRIREWFVQQKIERERERHGGNGRIIRERAVLTISREYGAGGHSVAERVSQELGSDWKIWDRELVDAIAESAHVRKEMVEMLDEQSHSLIEQILRYSVNCYPLSPDRFHRELVEVLVSLAHQGNKIIIGRGANYVLSPAFKVRLIGSVDFRMKEIERREGLSRPEALSKLRRIDKQRADYVRNLFGRDIADPAGYDMILRMDHMQIDTASSAIAAAVLEHMTAVRNQAVHRP